MASRLLLFARRRGLPAAVGATRSEATVAGAAATAAEAEPSAAAGSQQSFPGIVEQLTAGIKDPIQQQKLREALVLPEDEAQQLELFRRHNSSMDYQQHMVLAKVVQLDRKRVHLHTGLRGSRMLRSEIQPDAVVGTTVSSAVPREREELRVGDIVQVYLDEAETPEGDMLISGQHAAGHLRAQAVWKELEQRMNDKRTVKGRILNQLAGGYSVGIAGLVTFCPAVYCMPQTARRVGELQDFKILVMKKERNNVTVADARVDVEAALVAQQLRRQAAAGRPPREVRPSQQEIRRVGEELRQVLNIRDSAAVGNGSSGAAVGQAPIGRP